MAVWGCGRPPAHPLSRRVSPAPCGVSLAASGRSQSAFLCPGLAGVVLDSDTNVVRISYPPNFPPNFFHFFFAAPTKPAPPKGFRRKKIFRNFTRSRSAPPKSGANCVPGELESVPGEHPGAEVRPGLCTHGRKWVHISPLHRGRTYPNQVDRGRIQDTGQGRIDGVGDSSGCGNDCTHFKTLGGRQTIVSEGG